MSTFKARDFYIVGIGASAGGLDAIQKLFNHIPADIGMAFVIIQHLSPDFKSLMQELLAKHTEMPIYTAEDQQEVHPNCIYLTHRNKNLVIKDNKLLLLEKAPKHNLNLPIDIFFHSLGEEWKEKSIGIILSGTGSDGSRGIKTIKESGGIILVQDPLSAQFNGMPNAAISSGLAEFISEPEAMTKILEKIPNISLAKDLVNDKGNDTIFLNILEEIYRNSGIDFKQYKRNTLVRRIEKRMSLKNKEQLLDYLDFLKSSPDEAVLLKQDFLIGVTSFFRDREAFEKLKTAIIPALFRDKKPTDTIRVWVVACSTGEEAYSIAMLIDEYIQENQIRNDFKIFATDIDNTAVQAAGSGKFHIGNISELDRKYLDTYFIKNVDSIQIIKRIRDKMVFSSHNAIKDTPFIRMDLVSCRNMLIYLNNASQQKVLTNLLFALNPSGYLFLGLSESINDISTYFTVVDQKAKIFRNIATAKPTPYFEHPESSPRNFFGKPNKETETKSEQIVKEQSELVFYRYLSNTYSPSCIFFDSQFNILYIKGDAGKYLHFKQGVFQRNLLKMIDEVTATVLQEKVKSLMEENKIILIKNILVASPDEPKSFDIYLQRLSEADGLKDCYLIQFSDREVAIAEEIEFSKIPFEKVQDVKMKELELELSQTKVQLQNVVEELETSNEELQASNEELMASNEELQSTNEELQSVNEELYTVNYELQEKNKELNILNNDTNNLFNSTDVGTLFLDEELRIRKFTPSLQKHFKLNDKDIGRSISNFAATFKEEIKLKMIDDSLKSLNEVVALEDEIRDDTGKYYIRRISPFITLDRKVDGVVITFVDVTHLRNLYNTLEDKERIIEKESLYNKSIIENNSFYVVKTDLQGNYTYFNKYFSEMFGVKLEDWVGKNSLESILGDNHEACMKAVEKCFAEPEKSVWVNLRKPSPNGIINSQWEFKLLKNESGELFEILCLGHEITSLIKKQEELQAQLNINMEQKNRLIQFAHILSHNFRSHVANLKGLVALAEALPLEERADFFSMIKTVANSLDETLINLNETISIQTNDHILIKNISILQAMKLVENSLSLSIADTGARIMYDFSESDIIQANPAYLDSILLNLITNAIKYRKPNQVPYINVRLVQLENATQLIIQDNGMGIDLVKNGNKVFGMYKTFHGNKDAKGLGLFITRTQVEAMHGSVKMESQPGEGTTLIIELPFSKQLNLE